MENVYSTNNKEENEKSNKPNKIGFDKTKIIKFPDITKNDNYDLEINSKIPECLVVKYNNTDSHLAAGYTDGQIIVYDLINQENNNEQNKIMKYSDASVTSLRWKPKQDNKNKNILLSISTDGNIIYWHSSSGKILHRIEEPKKVLLALDYSADGKSFAVGGDDKMLKIYDENMKVLTAKFLPGTESKLGHENRIYSISFNKNINFENAVISGGWDRSILLYDLRAKNVIGKIHGPYICGDSLDFCEYSILAGSYNYNNQMIRYDTRTLKTINILSWDEDNASFKANIYCAKYAPNKENVFGICTSNANYIRLYNIEEESQNPILTTKALDKPIYSFDFSRSGKHIAYGGEYNYIGILTI